MFKKINFMLLLLGSSVLCAAETGKAQWSYHGNTSPEHWGDLTPSYATCKGYNQTPINIDQTAKTKLASLHINYPSSAQTIVNNGHTIQVNYAEGGSIKVDGEDYALKQMHFHAPSENHIKGKSYPMELHLVHANKQGGLAVIGVMFNEGKENPALATIWQQMPKAAGNPVNVAADHAILASAFLPKKQSYYRFSGSLTTPPCSEGVRWLVMKTPLEASAAQIKAFEQTMGTHTNRPLQQLNGRVVLE